MRFLVDAQLPPALALWLNTKGHAAQHVGECGLAQATDAAIWAYAANTGAAIVANDEDFAQMQALGRVGPPIVWVRLANSRRQYLIDRMAEALPGVEFALGRGEMLVEIV